MNIRRFGISCAIAVASSFTFNTVAGALPLIPVRLTSHLFGRYVVGTPGGASNGMGYAELALYPASSTLTKACFFVTAKSIATMSNISLYQGAAGSNSNIPLVTVPITTAPTNFNGLQSLASCVDIPSVVAGAFIADSQNYYIVVNRTITFPNGTIRGQFFN